MKSLGLLKKSLVYIIAAYARSLYLCTRFQTAKYLLQINGQIPFPPWPKPA